MHVLLVGPDLEENLSLRYLSSALKAAGHRATIARFDSMQDFDRVVFEARGADLIGLSLCYQIRAMDFLKLARTLKARNPERPVLAGGHYASCAARELLEMHEELDLIAVHEAERTLVELAELNALTPEALASIPGIVYRDGGRVVATPPREILADLDELPWPDRTGPARLLAGVPTSYMMGSRGCLSACDYCCISTLHRLVPGRRFRQRSPERIADEMAWLYHQRGVRQYIFHDDNFLVPAVPRNLERIDALDRELRKRDVRDICLALKCRPGDVNREVFRRLRQMGLLRVFLGIESGTAAGLASLGRRQNVEDQHRALDLCAELGVSTQYTIIVFHPEATPATILDDLAFVRAHLTQSFSFCRAEIYAGTPLEQRMVRAGRARGDYLGRTYTYTDPAIPQLWDLWETLFRTRAWSQNHLLGQVVRLDHLITVYDHFYEGPEVQALVTDFRALKLEVNRDSVDLFEDLVRSCLDLGGSELETRMGELARQEMVSRDRFQRRLCAINEALHRSALGLVGLPFGDAPPPPRRGIPTLPRHAAAALLAAGLLGCGGNSSTDHGTGGITGNAGAGTTSGGSSDTGGFVNTGGMFEAPPTGGFNTGGTGGFVNTGGMFEAPPPVGGFGVDTGGTTSAGARTDGGTDGSSDGGQGNVGGT